MKNLLKEIFGRGGKEYEKVEPIDPELAIRKAINVTGRVQGVGFRFFTQGEAIELRLTGWVKNETDGSVSMEVQGLPAAVDKLIERLQKGNGYSKVVTLDAKDLEVEKGEDRFVITY